MPPKYGFALPGMVELLRRWNLYTNTRVRKHYDNYKYLKDVRHRPSQGSLDKLRKIKYEEFLEKPLGRIIHLQSFGKDAWSFLELLRLQQALINSQLFDSGSQDQRSVVSFSLCRPTEAQHPFHFKRREPFSWHQKSHHLFRQVLQFPLLWLIKKAPF